MPAVTIGSGELARTFDGAQIAESKTDKWPRWIEFGIWKLDDGTGYAFYRAGMSVLYHTENTSCYRGRGMKAGKPATIDDLPDNAAPCSVCRPMGTEQLADRADKGHTDHIRFETPRITLLMGLTPAEVITEAITVPGTGGGLGRTSVSAPVADLLEQAVRNDPAFAAVWDPRTRLFRETKAG
jgi:hypothetical protein